MTRRNAVLLLLVAAFSTSAIIAQPDQSHLKDSSPRSYFRLKSPASRAARLELEAKGVRFLEPAGRDAFTVSVPARAAQALQSILPLEGISPESKMGEDLRSENPPAYAKSELQGQAAVDVDVVYYKDTPEDSALNGLAALGASVLSRAPEFSRVTARVPAGKVGDLASSPWLQAVDAIPAPYREFNNSDTAAALSIPKIRDEGLRLTGEGVRVGVIDGGAIDTHVEFEGRLTRIDNLFVSAHATHVAGTIGAAGINEPIVKGMAPKALLYSYDFYSDVTVKTLQMRQSLNIDITNNSYGTSISDSLGNCNSYGAYGVREREFDSLIRESGISVVFSMGNDRDLPSCVIQPRAGFYTVSRPASAKNVISVGAVGASAGLSSFSNIGPARDGRLKPELVAPGVDVTSTMPRNTSGRASGTSMSSPAVTGLGALLIQQYRSLKAEAPPAALLKAILLNTATDLGNPGPDYTYGYGMPNASAASAVISSERFLRSSVTAGQPRTHEIEVPAGTSHLRVMLAWSDLPAPLFAEATLVNDLNLVLTKPDGTTTVLPLTLDPFAPSANAVPAVNRRDNAEQAVVANPEPGKWTVSVSASALGSDSQDYALTWNFAPIEPAPCSMTVVPAVLSLPLEGGVAAFAVNSSNACPAWKFEPQAPWIRVSQTEPRTSSTAVKVTAERNTESGSRESTIKFDSYEVKVRQAASCTVSYITPGEPLNDLLGANDCQSKYGTYEKHYKFTGSAGQAVAVEMRSQDFDAYLELRMPDGGILAFNDDDYAGSNSRIPQGAGSVFLPISGEYTVVATSFSPAEAGVFNLALYFVQGADRRDAPRLVAGCPSELADALDPATAARTGRRGDIFPTHVYLFMGRIGQTFDATILEASFDSVLYLVSPGGALFAANDDATPDGLSRINVILNETGLWRLEVSAYSPDMKGPYRARISGCEAPPQ